MKLRTIFASAALAVAFTAAQAVAEDQDHDKHHPAQQQGGKPSGPPPQGQNPMGHKGQGNMGQPGQMGGPNHTQHNNMTGGQMQMQGPNHGQMMMGGHNNMMGGQANRHANFDRHAYQRNFTAPRQFHIGVYERPHGWYEHRWVYGEILPPFFWSQNYWLADYNDYGLTEPPPGFIWVRYGDDALLIDQYSGEVLQVEYAVFD